MKRLKKLLRDKRGESMVELVVAFTLFMLALAMLTAMVSVGLKLNRMAADADREYYSEFSDDASYVMNVSVSTDMTGFDSAVLPEPTTIPYYRNDAGLIYFCFDASPSATPTPTPSPEPTDGGKTP